MRTLQEIDKDYRVIEALSASKLKDLLTSPALFYKRHILKEMPDKDTYALDFGTKVHAAILEPELFDISYKTFGTYPCLPVEDYEKIKGRCQWTKIEDAPNDGNIYFQHATSPDSIKTVVDRLSEHYKKEILLPTETKQIEMLLAELSLNPQTHALLSKPLEAEKVLMTVTDDIELKSKLDAIVDNEIVLDYKTCEHAINDELITWSIKKYSYDLQAYFYYYMAERNGYDIKEFNWIFQNKHSGQCAVVPCPDNLLEAGARKMKLGLEIYTRCMDTGSWCDWCDPETGATNMEAPLDLTRAVEKIYGNS